MLSEFKIQYILNYVSIVPINSVGIFVEKKATTKLNQIQEGKTASPKECFLLVVVLKKQHNIFDQKAQ